MSVTDANGDGIAVTLQRNLLALGYVTVTDIFRVEK